MAGRPLQATLGVENFPVRGSRLCDVPAFLRAYGRVKLAAAIANHELGVITSRERTAIVLACDEVIAGRHDEHFVTPLIQGGGGTLTNMNLNEVIAARATELAFRDAGTRPSSTGVIHPLTHVNASQSTNDTYPTAMALCVLELVADPVAALGRLVEALRMKGTEFETTPHLGRTCLQDAVTLTAGQTHRAQAEAVQRSAQALAAETVELTAVPMGATAIGTGLGAPRGFADRAVEVLAELTGVPLTLSTNPFDALANLDRYSAIAGAGSRAAITMAKVAADLRLLASGPSGGFGDITLPVVQMGSSIMPGKVNPVIPEFVMQLSHRVRGQALTVDCAVADGDLELNAMEPVILDAIVTLAADLTAAADTFALRCIEGLRWDGPRRRTNLAGALDHWVELAAVEGYESVAARREAGEEQPDTHGPGPESSEAR